MRSVRAGVPVNTSKLRSVALPGIVFLAASGGIGGAGYAYQRRQDHVVRARAEEQLSAVAYSKASQIAVWWRERAGDARLCVSTSLTAEPALAVLAGTASPAVRKVLADLYRNLLDSYHYRSVCLADDREQVLLKAGESCASRVDVATLVARALQAGEIVFSDFLVDPDTSEAHIAVVAPLRHGSTRGAVVLRMDARDFLFPLLRSWPTTTETGEIHLVRREGNEIVDLSEPRSSWGSVNAVRPGTARVGLPPALAVLEPRKPVLGRDPRGATVLAVARSIPETPWFVVATMDAREFEGPARQSGRAVGAIVAGLVLAAAGVLALWWRRQTQRFATAQQRLEAMLSEARLRSLERHVNEIELILRPDGSIVEVNDRAIAAYGYDRDTLRTMNVCTLHAGGPDGIQRALTGMRAQAGARFEAEHRRRDGSSFPVEVSARIFQAGGDTYYHCLVRDLTERRRAEAELRLAEEHLRLALEGSDACFWDWDLRARRLHVDARWARAFGADANVIEATPDVPPALLAAAEDLPRFREQLALCLSDVSATLYSEHRVRGRSGELTSVRLNGRVVERQVDGTPIRLAGTLADVEHRKQLEQRLARAERLASLVALASGTAHEINSPLACVLANTSCALAALDAIPPAAREAWNTAAHGDLNEAREALRDVIDAARRVRDIVADLRRFSMAQEDLDARTDVRSAIDQALRLAAPDLQRCRAVKVSIPDLPAVRANEANLVQALAVILVNAGQATGASPNDVSIEAGHVAGGGHVAISVSDTGTGIARDALPRIFDPYFTTKGVGVRGVGLSMCLGIVKSLGGDIEVESLAGKGSVFRVLLPVGVPPAEAAGTAAIDRASFGAIARAR